MVINRPMAIVAVTALSVMFVIGVGLTLWLAHRSEPPRGTVAQVVLQPVRTVAAPPPQTPQQAPSIQIVPQAAAQPASPQYVAPPSPPIDEPTTVTARVPRKYIADTFSVYSRTTPIPEQFMTVVQSRPFNLIPLFRGTACIDFFMAHDRPMGRFCSGDDQRWLAPVAYADTMRAFNQNTVQIIFVQCPKIRELTTHFPHTWFIGDQGFPPDAPCGYED